MISFSWPALLTRGLAATALFAAGGTQGCAVLLQPPVALDQATWDAAQPTRFQPATWRSIADAGAGDAGASAAMSDVLVGARAVQIRDTEQENLSVETHFIVTEFDKDRGAGELPVSTTGIPLNLDFELGNLSGWKAEGAAFAGQPVEGDAVAARRTDMRSNHQGRFWIGSFERAGDRPVGTLTSDSFKVTRPYGSFLIGGGASGDTRVELVDKVADKVLFTALGRNTENMRLVVVDLKRCLDLEIFIRLVDHSRGGWGHLNFDNFRLHAEQPGPVSRPDVSLVADEYPHRGLSAVKAADAMKLPEGFSAIAAAAEPDVQQPIAMALDDRGRVWIAEAYEYPSRAAGDTGRDRILIFEDSDGDGTLESRKVFAEGLNLVSGLEVGFGGVWVGAAPYLLFISDADGDDVPDSEPQVLLDGWGYQDTHETLNAFIWGPDGWLYGCHGVFTHSRVGKPGTPDEQRERINAGIWRYHPTRHTFEVFAHGTSNPWGIDFNDRGQAFLTACVIPHLYHVIQGGRYERQAGQHFNPYTYDDIKTIADHRHYLGANPHGGNGKSDSAGGGHAHAGAMDTRGMDTRCHRGHKVPPTYY